VCLERLAMITLLNLIRNPTENRTDVKHRSKKMVQPLQNKEATQTKREMKKAIMEASAYITLDKRITRVEGLRLHAGSKSKVKKIKMSMLVSKYLPEYNNVLTHL